MRVHFTYAAPPPLETVFPLAAGQAYWRELHRCAGCGHYLEWFTADQTALYDAEYVSTTYGDADGIRRAFDRINALPPEKSDNVGRVRYINSFCQARWAQPNSGRRVLDVGAGLGVFPYRMRLAEWQCVTLEMDSRLVEHHRSVIGAHGVVGDVRTVDGLGMFELVTFNKVLEHVVDPVDMLSSVKRLLQPEGLIYIELPDGEAAEAEGKEREEYLLGHRHVFSFASYSLLVAKAGLELIACERLREPSSKLTLRGFARKRH
jgi:2-polyprenyl-3-methyl-5-hydroxy-6-metoxy-1,4-benzoquinol methylase